MEKPFLIPFVLNKTSPETVEIDHQMAAMQTSIAQYHGDSDGDQWEEGEVVGAFKAPTTESEC